MPRHSKNGVWFEYHSTPLCKVNSVQKWNDLELIEQAKELYGLEANQWKEEKANQTVTNYSLLAIFPLPIGKQCNQKRNNKFK